MAACKFAVGVIAVFCFSLYGVDGQDYDPTDFVQILMSHACVVSCSDKISCWGSNNGYGQLGSNNTNLTENQIEMRDVKQISAGHAHTCALKNDGSVFYWGYKIVGRLGNALNPLTYNATYNATSIFISNVKQISAGGIHTCALKNDGSVFCWGWNEGGQLGNALNSGINNGTSTPLNVNIRNVKQISAGALHTCALKNDGSVSCWGYNIFGQLGNSQNIGTDNANPNPLNVNISNVKQISAGQRHTCALKNDGSVFCWGYNKFGQLGNSFNYNLTENANPNPLKVNISNVKQISVAPLHTCALKNDGTVFCWGLNIAFKIARGSTFTPEETEMTPYNNVVGNIVGLVAAVHSTCTLYDTKEVYCIGKQDIDISQFFYKAATDVAFLSDSIGENTCSTNDDDDDDTKLSIPVIVGIVAGSVLLFGGIVYYSLKRSAKGYEYVLNK